MKYLLIPHQSQHFAGQLTRQTASDGVESLDSAFGVEQSLMVCCSAFHGISVAAAAAPGTLKKIPKMVLVRREWDRDDYGLNLTNLPLAKKEPTAGSAKKSRKDMGTPDLFGNSEEEA